MQDQDHKRTLILLEDSYTTYYQQVPENQNIYYPNIGIPDVDCVEKTWCRRFMAQENLELLINDSWSGATVCTTVRPAHPIDTAFVRRMQKTLNGDLRPDVIVLFGGTNDSWIDCPLGENKYSGWTEKDDRSVLPAFCHMISYVKEHNPQAKVLCVLNTELKEEIGVNVQAACAHFGVFCVKLKEIDKVDGHPNDKGMQQIADQVARALREAY